MNIFDYIEQDRRLPFYFSAVKTLHGYLTNLENYNNGYGFELLGSAESSTMYNVKYRLYNDATAPYTNCDLLAMIEFTYWKNLKTLQIEINDKTKGKIGGNAYSSYEYDLFKLHNSMFVFNDEYSIKGLFKDYGVNVKFGKAAIKGIDLTPTQFKDIVNEMMINSYSVMRNVYFKLR